MSKSVVDLLTASEQRRAQGPWVPACGGTEQPFVTRTGYRIQYMWQPSTGRHAYLNLDTDVIVDDSSLSVVLGFF